MSIGQRIKKLRKEMGLSADQLAAKLGKNRATIFRYENGDIENLPLDILTPLAKALNTTPAYIMGWEDMRKNNDFIADAVVKMQNDENFLNAVKSIYNMDGDKLKGLLTFLQ